MNYLKKLITEKLLMVVVQLKKLIIKTTDHDHDKYITN